MFGKAPRGVSDRPKVQKTDRNVPSWIWLLVAVFIFLCLVIAVLSWNPWQPSNSSSPATPPKVTNDNTQDTNKDYLFYDLLPQQQVMPVPDQAVPQSQIPQAIVVIDAPKTAQKEKDLLDPFDEGYQGAKISVDPRFILQVRSFEDPDSADARRAEIVLNGLSAEVIISNEGNKVWYRVLSGPYENQEAAHIAQQTLQNAGIDSIIIKQSPTL